MSDPNQQERDPNGSENYTAHNSRKRRRRRQEREDDPPPGGHYAQQASMPIFTDYGHHGHHGRHGLHGIMPYDIGRSLQPASWPESPFGNHDMLVRQPMFGPPQAPHVTQPSDGAYYWVPLPGQDRHPMPTSMRHPSSMPAELRNWIPYVTQMDPRLGTIHPGHYVETYEARIYPSRRRERRAKRRVQPGSPIDNISRGENIGSMEGGANVLVKKLRNDSSVKTTLLHGILGYKKGDSDNE